jgi:pimeloyl-ACP methyl ester carboxylesterase
MYGTNVFPFLSVLLIACAPPVFASFQDNSTAPADTLINVGGHRLHFKVWDRKSDLTLVFENGGGSDLQTWDSVPAMAAHMFPVRVIAYDRAGLGTSELGPADLSPAREIEQLRLGLSRLGADRIIVIGHSFGGLLALYHGFLHPDSVAGLVLVDPMNVPFIRSMTLDWLMRTVPDIADPTTPRDIAIMRMKRMMPDLVDRVEPAMLATHLPVVVISSGLPWWNDPTADQAWRESHRTFVSAAPGRELVVATRSTHRIAATEPGLILQAIGQLLTLVD